MELKKVPASYTPTSGITLATRKGLTLSQYTTKTPWNLTPNLFVTPTGAIIGTPKAASSFVGSYKLNKPPSKVTTPTRYPAITSTVRPTYPTGSGSRTTLGVLPGDKISPTTPHYYTGQAPHATNPTTSNTGNAGGGAGAPSATPNPPIVTPYTRSPYTVQAPTPMVITRSSGTSTSSSSSKWWLIGAIVAVGGGLYLWYRHNKQQGTEAFQ